MAAFLAGASMLHWIVDKEITLSLVSHRLPFWFLVFSLFLPRVALAVAWLQGVLLPFHLQGLIPLVIAIILPRVLILFLIYRGPGVQPLVCDSCGGGADGLGRRRTSDFAETLSGRVVRLRPRRVILETYGTAHSWNIRRDRYGRAAIYSVIEQSSVV